MVRKLVFILGFLLVFFVIDAQTNYQNLYNWASHPYKKNFGDSVPKPLKSNVTADSSVDIFFVHPTTYINAAKEFGQNAIIENDELNNTTDATAILYQATIFNAAGRLFAPRYRQAHLSCYYPITNEDSNAAINAFDTAYADVKAAFEYYLKHYNNGRPIVIASHSQGTTHAKKLVKDFFDGKDLQQKLVVAYLVGMPVELNYFAKIKPCNQPNQIGCICSWRTFKNGYKPNYILQEKDTMIVTNPITWNAEMPIATRFNNKGTMLKNFNKILMNVVDAKVGSNVLWTQKPKFFGNIFLTTKNYHIADYNFFYVSIRENVALRISEFKKKILQ